MMVRSFQLIHYFNIFVLPSITEGIPITILEAMQSRIPIVATAVGGIPEVLENDVNGLLAEPGDPSSLANAIKKLWTDSRLAASLADAAYQRVTSLYTSETMATEYLKVYEESLNSFKTKYKL